MNKCFGDLQDNIGPNLDQSFDEEFAKGVA